MALDKTRLADAIDLAYTNLKAAHPNGPTQRHFVDALAEAIVDEMHNAELTTTVVGALAPAPAPGGVTCAVNLGSGMAQGDVTVTGSIT